MSTRIEEDLLGKAEVPADVYYGVHTQRAVDNFKLSASTLNDLPEFIRGMAQVKKATAIANRRLHVLPREKAEAIAWACDQILDEGRCMDQFPIDLFQGGAGTSANMNTNEVVANLALEYVGAEKGSYDIINPNDDVNMSQSTNDAYPTGLRLGVYYAVQGLLEELDEQRTISNAATSLLEVNLGATAIGTGINTPNGYKDQVVTALREVTGLDIQASPDLIEATSDTGDYVMMHGAIKRAAMKLSKMCNDLRLLSSGPRAGLNEINLPERQAGSSIMPAKVNPVIPEVVNQVCFKVFGNDVTVSMAAEAGQLQLNVMEPVIAQSLFESIRLLANAARTLREKCVVGITANKDVCEAYVTNSIGIVTYLNPVIGHHNGDIIGREAASTGKSVYDLVLEKGLIEEEDLKRLLSKENLMHPEFRGKLYVDEDDAN